jgi:hypothetical protein
LKVGGIKIKTMRLLKPLSIVLVMVLTTFALTLLIKNDNPTYVVTLEDNTTFDAKRVTYYASGIADIRKTNDERIQIPTRSIKQVKIIENK